MHGFDNWKAAYETSCLGFHHLYIDDTLPRSFDPQDPDPDADSEDEDVPHDHEDEDFVADWMQEAGRHPNEAVESAINNLGLRDMDLEHDWFENSPSQLVINAASTWLEDQVKESPDDDVQIVPDADYAHLKGEQKLVFLQVMAYFKKLKILNEDDEPLPLRINVDGKAGTGKSFLIWEISHTLRDLYVVLKVWSIGPKKRPKSD